MSSNTRAVQPTGQKGLINTDAERRMVTGYPNSNGTFGRIRHFVERTVTAAKSNFWLNLFSFIILVIAIVIAVLFGADFAALIL